MASKRSPDLNREEFSLPTITWQSARGSREVPCQCALKPAKTSRCRDVNCSSLIKAKEFARSMKNRDLESNAFLFATDINPKGYQSIFMEDYGRPSPVFTIKNVYQAKKFIEQENKRKAAKENVPNDVEDGSAAVFQPNRRIVEGSVVLTGNDIKKLQRASELRIMQGLQNHTASGKGDSMYHNDFGHFAYGRPNIWPRPKDSQVLSLSHLKPSIGPQKTYQAEFGPGRSGLRSALLDKAHQDRQDAAQKNMQRVTRDTVELAWGPDPFSIGGPISMFHRDFQNPPLGFRSLPPQHAPQQPNPIVHRSANIPQSTSLTESENKWTYRTPVPASESEQGLAKQRARDSQITHFSFGSASPEFVTEHHTKFWDMTGCSCEIEIEN